VSGRPKFPKIPASPMFLASQLLLGGEKTKMEKKTAEECM
jgi:hypothetical protein